MHACTFNIEPVQPSDATRHDGECKTRLCEQAERVLDCGSPLCPTHPPTASKRNAPLALAGPVRGAGAGSRKEFWREKQGPMGYARDPSVVGLTRQAPRATAYLLSGDLLIPFLPLKSPFSHSTRHILGCVPRDFVPFCEITLQRFYLQIAYFANV